jgi:hypothetical protein
MDGITGLPRVNGTNQAHERPGGNQQQADAFRQAMEEQSDGTAAEREPDPPMRRALQQRLPNDRKQDEEAHHIDVVA